MSTVEQRIRGLSGRKVLKTLRSPNKLIRAARAQWQLRSCTTVPATVRVIGRVLVENHGEIHIGDRVLMEAHVVPSQLVAWQLGKLSIGDRTYVNYGASISAHEHVSIGDDCLIGQYAIIMDSDYHDVVTRVSPGPVEPIVIEDRVWLGARVTILKGVRIGRGSVIGAGSVVTRDVPPDSFAAGSPARVVRSIR